MRLAVLGGIAACKAASKESPYSSAYFACVHTCDQEHATSVLPFHTDAVITNTIAPLTLLPLLLFPVAAGLTMIDRRSEEREIATSTIIMYTVRHAVIG